MVQRAVTFEAWIREVDSLIAKSAGGLTSGDLPDCPYYDWYDQRVSPAAAAKRAIKLAMTY